MGLCNATAKNCTLWFQRQDNNRLPADPDIAGIGVSEECLTYSRSAIDY